MRRLRKKLGGYADQYIETIFGIGYRFQPYHAPRFFQPAVSEARDRHRRLSAPREREFDTPFSVLLA